MVEVFETQKLFYRNVPPRLALAKLAWRLNELAAGGGSETSL
jgi:hypothetical protein